MKLVKLADAQHVRGKICLCYAYTVSEYTESFIHYIFKE